jgi:hypothetical protein
MAALLSFTLRPCGTSAEKNPSQAGVRHAARSSQVCLEGFLDAMVLVEGLKRAGRDVTREKFIAGIESILSDDREE